MAARISWPGIALGRIADSDIGPKRPSGKRRRRGDHEHRRARLARHALWPQKDTVALESKMPPDSQLEMEGATRDSPAHWSDGVRHQPAEGLELSPYPWDCVALQFRRNIVLRPGTQRSSPFAQEQRDSRSRDSKGRAAPLIRAD